MGYNRSGTRRKQKLKRRKREEARLAAKTAAQAGTGKPAAAAKPQGGNA